MRNGILFGAVVAACVAAFAFLVRPLQSESSDSAEEIAGRDVRGSREAAEAWPGPSEPEARRLEAALAAYRTGSPPVPRPAGLAEESEGVLAGRVRWIEIQDLFAWAAAQGAPVRSLEVKALADDPELADCRVVLGPGAGR